MIVANKNEKLDKAICKIVDGAASMIDALDPQLRAVAAKGLFSLAMWVIHMAKCCEPDPCPPLCPPPPPVCQ
jgi:hypothetical protein